MATRTMDMNVEPTEVTTDTQESEMNIQLELEQYKAAHTALQKKYSKLFELYANILDKFLNE